MRPCLDWGHRITLVKQFTSIEYPIDLHARMSFTWIVRPCMPRIWTAGHRTRKLLLSLPDRKLFVLLIIRDKWTDNMKVRLCSDTIIILCKLVYCQWMSRAKCSGIIFKKGCLAGSGPGKSQHFARQAQPICQHRIRWHTTCHRSTRM